MDTYKSKRELIDRTDLDWLISDRLPGLGGSFLKSQEIVDDKMIYYKMSRYNNVRGIIGHESINEIICMNIADQLGFNTLRCELLHCNVVVNGKLIKTFITKFLDYRQPGDKTISFEDYYELVREDTQKPLDVFLELDEEYVYQMLVLDYIIFNRDRHGANIDIILRDGRYIMAPLFDHGLSFMCSCNSEYFARFDIMRSGPVNNYVGSLDVEKNLKFVPEYFIAGLQKPVDIFAGLDDVREYMPDIFWKRIQEMFDRRFDYVKNLYHSKR